MPLWFGPDDEGGFYAASAALVQRYEGMHNDGLGWIVEQILEFKWMYLDGNLVTWTQADIDTILFEVYPAKSLINPADQGDVIRGFAGLLRFLATMPLGGNESELERVAGHVEQSAAEFELAMADRDRFSLGKRLTAAMVAEGVDLGDQEAMDRWVAEFNGRSYEERGRVLGLSDEPSPEPGKRRSKPRAAGPSLRLRPVVLASEQELVAAAREATLVQQVTKLVTFVGPGRKLTDRGNLKVADGKALVELLKTGDRIDEQFGDQTFRTRSSTALRGVDRAFRLALAAGLLEKPTSRSVEAAASAALLDDSAPEAALLLFKTLVGEVGTTRYHDEPTRYGFGWYAEELDHHLLGMLSLLYETPEPFEIDVLAEMFWERLLEEFDLDHIGADRLEWEEEFVNRDLRLALDRLGELGLTLKSGEDRYTTEPKEAGGSVTLTPLGTWVVQRSLSELVDAPVAGALASVNAGELLRRVGDLPEDVGVLELRTWVERRGDSAAKLLVDAVVDSDETARLIGFRALTLIGPSASAEVATLERHPELGAYATVWQVDAGLSSVEDLDSAGEPQRFVRLLYAALALWGPDAVAKWLVPVAGRSGLDAALDNAWRVRLPETEVVLSVVGEHPDKDIAKSARKALFRYRSSRGATDSG